MNNIPFKDAILQQFFVQYSLQPIICFERGSNCAEHAVNLSNMCLYVYIFTKVQYTIHCRKQGCLQDAWSSHKKLVQHTAGFSGSTFLKFQLRFHAQNVLFPCKCVTVIQQGSACWSACSIWTCSFVKSTHEQHERMQHTFQKMQNLQLEIALLSVQYQIYTFRET